MLLEIAKTKKTRIEISERFDWIVAKKNDIKRKKKQLNMVYSKNYVKLQNTIGRHILLKNIAFGTYK